MTKCLVTGANGFVGSALVRQLRSMGCFSINAAVRKECSSPSGVALYSGFELSPNQDWRPALDNVECVLHTAALVHQVNGGLETFRQINVDGGLNLARQSARAGVRRFVFVSSIKVNGEESARGRPFKADDLPAPEGPYGISKCETEDELRQLAATTSMEVVIVRPPLVYGSGVKANFLTALQWLHKGIPLPFGAINNKRSFVALENLVDLIVTCIDHHAAANQTFIVSDDEDMSTPELLRRMGNALGKSTRLFPVPVRMLEAGAALLGNRELSRRLCGNLQVDISKTKALLGWTPLVSVDDGLRQAAEGFLNAAPPITQRGRT